MTASEALRRDLLAAAVVRGTFTLHSGQISDWYLDKYRMQADPLLLTRLAVALGTAIPADTTVLAGVELGAVPLTVATALWALLPFAIVRRAEKKYGTARAIEGADVAARHVVLLEDVLTTGESARRAADRLVAAGAERVTVLAVFDRGNGVAALRSAGYEANALFTVTEDGE